MPRGAACDDSAVDGFESRIQHEERQIATLAESITRLREQVVQKVRAWSA